MSTCPLAPAKEFLKKGFSGKYILVYVCPNGQADFLNSLHIFKKKMAQIPRNMRTMQQDQKGNGFQIIKSTIKNTCHASQKIETGK